jgi:hypothetical protein
MSETAQTTEIVAFTEHYRVQGQIALVPGARLTDFIRDPAKFIAVTAAIVSDREGKELFRCSFLDLGKDHIELILPAGTMEKTR